MCMQDRGRTHLCVCVREYVCAHVCVCVQACSSMSTCIGAVGKASWGSPGRVSLTSSPWQPHLQSLGWLPGGAWQVQSRRQLSRAPGARLWLAGGRESVCGPVGVAGRLLLPCPAPALWTGQAFGHSLPRYHCSMPRGGGAAAGRALPTAGLMAVSWYPHRCDSGHPKGRSSLLKSVPGQTRALGPLVELLPRP